MYMFYVFCKGRNSGLYIKANLKTVYMGDLLELQCIWTSGVNDSNEFSEISWAKVNDDMDNNVEYLKSTIKYVILSTEFRYLTQKNALTT